LRARGDSVDAAAIRTALSGIFGASQPLAIETLSSFGGADKVVQYSSELEAEDSGTMRS
jgi:hypothetical protein